MITALLDFFRVTRMLYVKKDKFVVLANEMMRYDIRYTSLKVTDDGRIFRMTEKEYKRLTLLTDIESFGLKTVKRNGLPQLLYRYRRRYGIVAGIILILTLNFLSTQYVWDVRVEGNERLSDAEIQEDLKKLGFGVGSNINSTDFYNICHEFLLINDSVSWISVNMEGTYAVVKLIEKSDKNIDRDNGTPSNIVAETDGEIVRIETESGQVEVSPGQTVKAGELLIGGVVKVGQGDSGRFVLVRSKGKVFAKTKRVFETDVPLQSVKSVLKERVNVKKSIVFFGKTLKLQENYSILDNKCDIITVSKRVVLFEGISDKLEIPLPISIQKEVAQIYVEENVSYTEEQALLIAEEKMSENVLSVLPEAEIISRESYYEVINGVLKLTWMIECIEDISSEVPIGIV